MFNLGIAYDAQVGLKLRLSSKLLMGVFGDMESISGVIFAVRSIHHRNIDMLVSYLVMNEAARFSFHWQNSYPKLMKLILKLKVERI